jgi:hypothetical protein
LTYYVLVFYLISLFSNCPVGDIYNLEVTACSQLHTNKGQVGEEQGTVVTTDYLDDDTIGD